MEALQLANGVPVKAVGRSKILWTAIGSVVVYVLSTFSGMDEHDKAQLIAAFGILQNVAIGAFRVWSNNTVTPNFVQK